MARNWGIPPKDEAAFGQARRARPLATLAVTAVFGVVGASVAAIGFGEARGLIDTLYRGWSLVFAVVAAGSGCWTYVWLTRPRFAAHFTGRGDAFSDLVRFYARAAAGLIVAILVARASHLVLGDMLSVLLLCFAGGAGAAAAFQTVIAFVPNYSTDKRA